MCVYMLFPSGIVLLCISEVKEKIKKNRMSMSKVGLSQHFWWHLKFINSCSVSSRIDLNVCQICRFNIYIVADVDKSGKMWQNQNSNREFVNIVLHILRYTYQIHTHLWKPRDSRGAMILQFGIIGPTNIPKKIY